MPFDQSATLATRADQGRLHDIPFSPNTAATRQRIRLVSLLGADATAALLTVALAVWTMWVISGRAPWSGPELEWRTALRLHGWTLVVIFAVLFGFLANSGHYTRRVPFWIELRELLVGCAAGFVAECLLSRDSEQPGDKIAGLVFWLLFLGTLLCLRACTRALLMRLRIWSIDTLVVGEPAAAQRLIDALGSQPSLGYNVVGRLAPELLSGIVRAQGLRNLLANSSAEFLILAGRAGDSATEADTITALDRLRVPFGLVSEVDTLPVRRSQEHYFFGHDVTFLTFNNNHARPLAQLTKRVLDMVLATAILVAIAPFMLCIAVLVRRDGGPVLFRQRRIGRNGTYYPCLKFRTMRVDADQLLRELLENDPVAAADWTLRQKLTQDPRITGLGHILRKTSLDELPQLFNVLRGQMSLVGPRPIVPSEVSRYGDHIAYYYETRPGLTGLWQVSGRSETSYDRRVQLDVWYVRNWSVWHDIVILLKTIPALLLRRGAV